MNARRLTLALVVALGISGLLTYWLSKRVASAQDASRASHKYAAASKPLDSGEVLKSGSVQMVEWPVSMALPGAHAKVEDVVGRNILYPLAEGEPILDRDLAAPGSGAGLAAKIPEGMRAISLKSDEVVGVAGFLLPGTHVDVLESHRSNDTSGELVTTTVLQDVEVLAAGQKIQPDPEGKPTSVNVVTLLLKPEDAEKIVLASTQGSIHFVLRNGSDSAVLADLGTQRWGSVNMAAASVPPGIYGKRLRHKAPQYRVETFLGDKKVVNSFN